LTDDPSPQHIAVTNFWTDRNKGDAAVNIATLRVLRAYFPHAHLHAYSYYGVNQIDVARRELSATRSEDLASFNGGLFPTYHKTERVDPSSDGALTSIYHVLRGVGVVTYSVVLLLLAYLHLLRPFSALFPREYRRSIRNFLTADLVVISTTNVRERDNQRFKPYFLYKELYHALLAIASRKPVALLGHSVWPLRSALSKRLIRWVTDRSILLTVREAISYCNLKGLTAQTIHVLPDFPFYLLTRDADRASRAQRPERVPPTIGLVFVDWHEGGRAKREAYIAVMTAFLRYLETYGAKIVIIPQIVYPPQDPREITATILSNAKVPDVEWCDDDLSLDDLLRLYATLDFVVATPLHSSIFSMCMGTPAIAIAYEGGPKHLGIMRMLDFEDLVLPYDDLTLNTLIDAFERAWHDRHAIRVKALTNSRHLGDQVLQHGALLRARLVPQNTQLRGRRPRPGSPSGFPARVTGSDASTPVCR
jgi:polysaccharide pyruvyl transferase WcaK-like protein